MDSAVRWILSLLVILPAFVLSTGCEQHGGEREDGVQAAGPSSGSTLPLEDRVTLFSGGGSDGASAETIRIGDAQGSLVEALACKNGRVVDAGSLAELRKKYNAADPRSGVREVDLRGGFVVPGLQDAHLDVARLGAVLGSALDLSAATSFAEVCESVSAAVEGLERGRWLVGHGWDDALWPEDLCDPALDASPLTLASPNHPVALWSREGARLVANHRALASARLVGPDARRPRPVGGEVIRNIDGDPTGVLLDTATELVAEKIQLARPVSRREDLLAAQKHLLSLGLTGVHDVGASADTLVAYRELDAAGELTLRVTAYLDATEKVSETELQGLPLKTGPGGRLAVPGLAYRIDGELVTHGAALLEPYEDLPRKRGRLRLETKDLRDRIAQCVKAGLQPALEPSGDRAARMALDVYQELKSAIPGAMKLRPRLEEAQIVVPKDWPRFPDIGVLASIQPARLAPGLPGSSERRSRIERLLGRRRAGGVFAWRRVAPELGVLAFGSDAPAVNSNPLLGLWAARRSDKGAMDGQVASGGLSGEQALAGYTTGPAYAAHQEGFRGRLLLGYDADFTVLDIDPVASPVDDLLGAKVLLVVIGGEVVWSADNSDQSE